MAGANGHELVRIETNILPRGKLIVVFCGLAFALLITFIDQNSIGIALPTIGVDLNSATTISWAGTSSLIANTVFQVLYGRISDIVGRKVVFLSAVALLALGDLLCGFAQTGPQLYAFRGISGVGTGGIMALAMMIVSDVVTLENRGKYQGILGSCVGLGNTIGPFLAAGFVQTSTWRGLFWCICPLAILSGIMVAFTLPPSKYSPLMSAALTIPFVATQSSFSIVSGQYISRRKRYGEIIWIGFILWTLGSGLVLLFSRSTPKWKIVIILLIEGAGVGFVFQPTLIAAQAHCLKRDRAVVISTRNFLRALGGAIGLAISSAIFSNSIKSRVNSFATPLPSGFKAQILASILSVPDLTSLTTAQKEEVLDAYMGASKSVFYLWVPIIGFCLGLCILIKDKGLQRPDEKPVVRQQEESSGSEVGVEETNVEGDAVERDLERGEMEEVKEEPKR
ncbi:MFS transporter protein [Rutstroemia sp. NJR-2017a BVV2]|nr:MFS transporter protein [Rutstroemia sp. NJR-2017a BVV2]